MMILSLTIFTVAMLCAAGLAAGTPRANYRLARVSRQRDIHYVEHDG